MSIWCSSEHDIVTVIITVTVTVTMTVTVRILAHGFHKNAKEEGRDRRSMIYINIDKQ